MTHGALFNGIAGFPLAAQWAGIKTTWTVEIDEFCNKVSKKHFPHAIQYNDIHEASNLPYVDIISGGFPCQPFSVAGLQRGNEDDRALWPQMLRIIREVRPAYVIGENVTGIISLALDDVLASLEAEGYTCETFVLPAAGVGAPHRRDRVWIVAHSNSNIRRCGASRKDSGPECEIRQRNCMEQSNQSSSVRPHANTNSKRLEVGGSQQGYSREEQPSFKGNSKIFTNPTCRRQQEQLLEPETTREKFSRTGPALDERDRPDFRLTEPPICSTNDGLPSGLVRNRAKQLKAYGNAIVPQVAYEIFKAISELLKFEKGGG